MKQPKQPSRLNLWFCRHLLLLDGVSIAAMLALWSKSTCPGRFLGQ